MRPSERAVLLTSAIIHAVARLITSYTGLSSTTASAAVDGAHVQGLQETLKGVHITILSISGQALNSMFVCDQASTIYAAYGKHPFGAAAAPQQDLG
jgi:hypothetical protein